MYSRSVVTISLRTLCFMKSLRSASSFGSSSGRTWWVSHFPFLCTSFLHSAQKGTLHSTHSSTAICSPHRSHSSRPASSTRLPLLSKRSTITAIKNLKMEHRKCTKRPDLGNYNYNNTTLLTEKTFPFSFPSFPFLLFISSFFVCVLLRR